MSQFFTGLPIGRKRVLFIDSVAVVVIGTILVFLGVIHIEGGYMIIEINHFRILSGILLILFATMNPIHMSTTFPTSVFILWDDEEEEKQQ